MYCLEAIKSSNERAAKKGATKAGNSHLLRESSHHLTSKVLILHSASMRSTVSIDRIDHPDTVATFLRRWKACKSTKARNIVVDSYF